MDWCMLFDFTALPITKLCLNIPLFLGRVTMSTQWLSVFCCGGPSLEQAVWTSSGFSWSSRFSGLSLSVPHGNRWGKATVCVPRVLEQMQVDTTQKQKAWPVFFCSPNETTSLFVEWFLQSPSAFIMQSMTLTWTSHICPAGNSDFRYWSDSSITTKQKLLWWEGVIGEQLCICISYTHRSHTVLANLCQVDIGCSQLRKCLHQVGLVAKLWRHFLD